MIKTNEQMAEELWRMMNPNETTPRNEKELALAIKLVIETDTMMIDLQQKLEKLRRTNVSNTSR